jgi:hypothetical protein
MRTGEAEEMAEETYGPAAPDKKQSAKLAKQAKQRNPITGLQPNSFTSVNVDRSKLPPANVTTKKARAPYLRQARALADPVTQGEAFTPHKMPDPSGAQTAGGNAKMVPDVKKSQREAARLRAAHRDAMAPDGAVNAQIGYRPPEGMSHSHFAWMMGAQHMFPNESAEQGTSKISQPHEHDPGITVQRRAEDLSATEYKKGTDVLAHYGHGSKDPIGSLEETHHRTLNRVIAEHVQAGVEESASQKFYGGRVQTSVPDAELDDKHDLAMKAVPSRLGQGVREIAMHPEFQAATPDLSHRERMHAATRVLNQAVADTSPNNKFRENDKWPNVEQGEEAAKSALENRDPKFISGRIQNNTKAANRTSDMVHTGNFDTHAVGDSPKTVAFRSALTDQTHADSFKVSDVHEASVIGPGLGTKKALNYINPDTGTGMPIHEDMGPRAARGLQPKNVVKPVVDKTTGEDTGQFVTKHDKGLSRPEEMLAKGGGTVHALNDYATRRVLARTHLSRGQDYGDNVHQVQAAAWGSQQLLRPDVNVSHADQYPVVRDWGAEGHAELTGLGHAFFGGDAPKGESMGPQFRENPNTKAMNKKGDQSHNPTKSKPYPVMPGEAR